MKRQTRNVTEPAGKGILAFLLAVAAGLTGCSVANTTPPPALIKVSITNKITQVTTGSAAVTFTATVQNDPANAGVT